MKAFTTAYGGEEFLVLPPKNIDEIAEKVREGFDFAEAEADNGVIPSRRRGFKPHGDIIFHVIGYSEGEPSWLEDEIVKRVGSYVSGKIDRKCSASGIFMHSTNLRERIYVTEFVITAFILS